MNNEERTTSNESSDPLDQALAQARWPEAKLDVHLRLARRYQIERARSLRTMILVRGTVALAASVMVVFGIARFMRTDRPAAKSGQPSVHTVVYATPRPIVRPPTPLEVAMLNVQLKQEPAANRGVPAPVLRPIARPPAQVAPAQVKIRPEIVDVSAIARELHERRRLDSRNSDLIAVLLAERSDQAIRIYLDLCVDESTRGEAIAAIDESKSPPIDRFIAALGDPLVDRRIAAARVLGHINGPDLTARLIKMTERDDSRREAMIALACSRGEAARQYVDRASQAGPLVSLARSVRLQYDIQ